MNIYLKKLALMVVLLLLAACVASVDQSLPYNNLPESIAATEVTLIASPSHPTATLPFDPIPAGEKVQILGTDKDAAWLLVLYNEQIGWMPTVFSRTNIGDIQTAFTFETPSEKCTKYVDATTDLAAPWVSSTNGSLLVLGSIYRSQTATPFDSAQLAINIEGSGTVIDSDYLHTVLTASSSIVFFTYSINDLQKGDQIQFQAENAGDEPLAFQALYFSDECRADFQRLPIGRLKTVDSTITTPSRNEASSATSEEKPPVIVHGNYIWSVRASNIDDAAAILVNGKMVAGGLYANGRGQTEWVDITEQMVPGEDAIVSLVSLNGAKEGAWGFYIRRGDTIIWGQESDGGAEYTMQYAKSMLINANGSVEEIDTSITPRSTLPGEWLVRVQDIDDIGVVLVNGQPIGGVFNCPNCKPNDRPRASTIDISPWLDAGKNNTVALAAWNTAKQFSYHFDLSKDGETLWQQDKRADAELGLVFSEQITITPDSEILVASSQQIAGALSKQSAAKPVVNDGKCNVIPTEKCIYSDQFDSWAVGLLDQLTSGDSWAVYEVAAPTILFHEGKFHLWFSGRSSDKGNWAIGYATSLTGADWEVESSPVLSGGEVGSWEGNGVSRPYVIFQNNQFEMFYHGFQKNGQTSIGFATSSDGINWEKSNQNPVFTSNPGLNWMSFSVRHPSVIYDGEKYKMWFSGVDKLDWQGNWRIGYAESEDGRSWRLMSDQPVISLGSESSWKSNAVLEPDVLLIDDVYHVWYAGRTNARTGDWRIGHATSLDGLVWTEDLNNPVFGLGPVDGFANAAVAHPSIAISRDGYHLWYAGTRAGIPGQQIGLATSKDGVRWLR